MSRRAPVSPRLGRRATPRPGGDAPARPGLAFRPTIDPEGAAIVVAQNERESPLAWLARRRGRDGRPLIDATQFEAGERLRADFTRARLGGLTSNWRGGERVSGGRPADDLGGAGLAARRRVAAALTAVGPGLDGVLVDVCCFLKGLEQVEMERHWPPRAAKVVLTLALDQLAAHYAPVAAAEGRARVPGRTWRSDDTPVPGRTGDAQP